MLSLGYCKSNCFSLPPPSLEAQGVMPQVGGSKTSNRGTMLEILSMSSHISIKTLFSSPLLILLEGSVSRQSTATALLQGQHTCSSEELCPLVPRTAVQLSGSTTLISTVQTKIFCRIKCSYFPKTCLMSPPLDSKLHGGRDNECQIYHYIS